MAAGSERAGSDVDLMVLGSASFADLARVLAPAQQALGREVNPTVMAPRDFARKFLAAGDGFARSVAKGPRIWLMGGEDDSAELAAHRQASGHVPTAAEVQRLLAAIDRNIADAEDSISGETRFDAAYKAVMQCALVAMLAAGFRPATNEPGVSPDDDPDAAVHAGRGQRRMGGARRAAPAAKRQRLHRCAHDA